MQPKKPRLGRLIYIPYKIRALAHLICRSNSSLKAPSLTNDSSLDLDAPDGDRGPQGGQRQALREDPFPAGIRRRILAAKPVLYRRRGGIALQEYVRTKAGPLLHILQPGMKTEHD